MGIGEQELGFRHIKFEVPLRPPSKSAEQAIIYTNLWFRRESSAGDIKWASPAQWCLEHEVR